MQVDQIHRENYGPLTTTKRKVFEHDYATLLRGRDLRKLEHKQRQLHNRRRQNELKKEKQLAKKQLRKQKLHQQLEKLQGQLAKIELEIEQEDQTMNSQTNPPFIQQSPVTEEPWVTWPNHQMEVRDEDEINNMWKNEMETYQIEQRNALLTGTKTNYAMDLPWDTQPNHPPPTPLTDTNSLQMERNPLPSFFDNPTRHEDMTDNVSPNLGTLEDQNFWDDFGILNIRVDQTKTCITSPYTGIHVQRDTGTMTLRVHYEDPKIQHLEVNIRCTLVRKDPVYRPYPIMDICPIHREEPDYLYSNHHVLQVREDESDPYPTYTYERQNRNSVVFRAYINGGRMDMTCPLKFMCNDTCDNHTTYFVTGAEAARDIWLVITLESPSWQQRMAQTKFTVWPKSKIQRRDIIKEYRRKTKGGNTQPLTKRIRTKRPNKETTLAGMNRMEARMVAYAIRTGTSLEQLLDRIATRFIDQRNQIQLASSWKISNKTNAITKATKLSKGYTVDEFLNFPKTFQ